MSKKPRQPRKREMVIAYPIQEPMQGFSAIASQHWKTARMLLDEIESEVSGGFPFHWKGASTLCLFHAALECFLNEELAIITARGLPDLNKMRLLQDDYVTEKIGPFIEHFQISSKFSSAIKDDVQRMCRVRNLAYHHSPEMRAVNECPRILMEVINQLGVTPVKISWASYLGHARILGWARDAVANFIGEFDRCLNRPPTLKSFGWTMPYERADEESPEDDPGPA